MGAIVPFELAETEGRFGRGSPVSRRAVERARAVRAQQPRLSVIVASIGSDAALDDYLASIASTCVRLGAEVIVARAGTARRLAHYGRLIGIRLLLAPPGATPAELRTIGVAESTGDIVVLLDDRAGVPINWAEALQPSKSGRNA